jgi:hypothetical protein
VQDSEERKDRGTGLKILGRFPRVCGTVSLSVLSEPSKAQPFPTFSRPSRMHMIVAESNALLLSLHLVYSRSVGLWM